MCWAAVNRAVNSRASVCNDSGRSCFKIPDSSRSSSHSMVSSVSSTTIRVWQRTLLATLLDRRLGSLLRRPCRFSATVFPLPVRRPRQAMHDKAEPPSTRMPSFGPATVVVWAQTTIYKSLITNSYRSTSPSTISIDPIAATTSAISRPSHIFGNSCRFANDAPRMCTLYGLAVPSLTT